MSIDTLLWDVHPSPLCTAVQYVTCRGKGIQGKDGVLERGKLSRSA